MEPEDKPKDQEGCDQDHLEGQAQRRMLDTSSSSCKSICYRSHSIDLLQIPVNRSDTDPNRSVTDHLNPTSTPKTSFMFRLAIRKISKMVTKINSSSNIVRCTVLFSESVATLVTSTGQVCSTVLRSSSSSPTLLRWLSFRQHMEGCGHVCLLCTCAYSKESRLKLRTCQGHFSASLLIGGQTDVATIAPSLLCVQSIYYSRTVSVHLHLLFSSKKLELFLKKGDVIHSVLPR